MSAAPTYDPTTNFADDEADSLSGRSTVDTSALDAELAAVSTSVNALITNLSAIQRDDGAVRDGAVGAYALALDALALIGSATGSSWNPRGAWTTATRYDPLDMVEQSGASYLCLQTNLSGTFGIDYGVGRWMVIGPTTGSIAASGVTVTPTGGISASTVQAALAELDAEKANVGDAVADGSITAAKLAAAAALGNIGALGIVAQYLGNSAIAFDGMINGDIYTTRTGNAETISIKTKAGNVPSADDPVIFAFRDVTANSGAQIVVRAIGALSLTISSGSTLGMANTVLSRLWLTAFYDAGVLRLGLVNTRSGVNIMPLKDDDLQSATAEGGSGGADSAQVIYSEATLASKAMRLVGYLEYTLATAGTWNTAPSKIQPFGPGVPRPGEVVQTQHSQSGAVATGTTTAPHNDTAMTSTQGDQYMSQAITPTSAANVLEIDHLGVYSNSAGAYFSVGLFQDAFTPALAVIFHSTFFNLTEGVVPLVHRMVASATAARTLKIRAGNSGAGTTTFNGNTGARTGGGVMASHLKITEFSA